MPGFRTISVQGQPSIVADASPDTLNIIGSNGIAITANSTNDTLTFSPAFGTTAGTICQGNDSRIGTGTPTSHATTHAAGGSDPIKLDALAAPDDVTTRNATTSAHGLLPKLSGVSTQYLSGTGAWSSPTGTSTTQLLPLGGGVDNGPSIQAAANSLPSGGILQLGAGQFRIDSAVVITTAITIQGVGWREGPNPGAGTWLTIYNSGFAPFTFTGLDARGTIVRDLAVWQSHSWAGNTPTDYDYVFKAVDCFGGVAFINLFLLSINRGILALTSGRVSLERIYGDIYRIGVYFENALDACRMSDCHFWPFAGSEAPRLAFKQANAIPVYLGRADGVYITDFFSFGYFTSVMCAGSATYGANTTIFLSNFYSDCCKYAVVYGTAATGGKMLADSMFTQHELYLGNGVPGAPVPGSAAILVQCADVIARVSALVVERCDTSAIRCTSTALRLYIGSLTVNRFTQASTTDPVINLSSPSTCVVSLGSAPDMLNEVGNLNYIRSTPRQTGVTPLIESQGKDPVIHLEVNAKGDFGSVILSSGGRWATRFDTPGDTSNTLLIRSATGDVSLIVEGPGANCDIGMYPSGTGRVKFGARVASADAAITGYIEIKDSGGNLRRLAVIG